MESPFGKRNLKWLGHQYSAFFVSFVSLWTGYLLHAQIEVFPRDIDLPKNLYVGQLITNEVKLRNNSGTPVRITGISPDCGCTVADLKPITLVENQEQTFKVIFDTAGKSGFQEHYVSIFTDSGAENIKITGRVSQPLRIFPHSLFVTLSLTDRTPYKTNLLLRFATEYPIPSKEDLKLQSSTDALTAELLPSKAADATYSISLSINLDQAMENLFPNMKVHVTDRRNGVKEMIAITLKLEVPFESKPEFLNLGVLERGDKKTASIELKRVSQQKLQLLGAKESHSWFKANLRTLDEKRWRLTVELVATPPSELKESAFVELLTDFRQLPRWRVPIVFASVNPKGGSCCGETKNN